MNIITNVFKSSLGKKYIMAVTGFVLFLFVVGHLAGNLQIFLGREAINRYGHFLQSNPELIWPARLGLLLMVGLHIWSATKLSLENKAARPVGYADYKPGRLQLRLAHDADERADRLRLHRLSPAALHRPGAVPSTSPGRTSPPSWSSSRAGSAERHDIFKMMVVGFSNPLGLGASTSWASALLCLHLSHGASSMFQSLGWKNEAYRPFLDKAARVVAVLIFLGYTSIPVAILLRLRKGGAEVI